MGAAHGDPSQSKCSQRPVRSALLIPSLSVTGIVKDALIWCVFSNFSPLFLSLHNSSLSLH